MKQELRRVQIAPYLPPDSACTNGSGSVAVGRSNGRVHFTFNYMFQNGCTYIYIYLHCCFSNSVKTTIRFSMSWPWTWKTKNLQLVCTKDTKKCCQNQKMLAKVSQMLPSKVIGGSWGSSWIFPRPNAIRILSAAMMIYMVEVAAATTKQQLDIQNYFFPLLLYKKFRQND